LAKKARYGVDRPDGIIMMVLGGGVLLVLGLSAVLPSWVGWVGLVVLFVMALFVVGDAQRSRAAKRELDSVTWWGDEKVLDVGCGTGLWLITAAKHLTTGRAVGIDVWNKRLQSGNSKRRTLENARLEGVSDRVEVRDGDVRKLPFKDGSFDVVVTSMVIHHVPGDEREKALAEITRVLNHGGLFIMRDLFPWTSQSSKLLHRLGVKEIQVTQDNSILSLFFGTRILRARKL
jgi:ubiquinone/menaquinone biosynthesis C-methylase UbiE